MSQTTTRGFTPGERAKVEALLRPAHPPGQAKLAGFVLVLPLAFASYTILNLVLPAPGFVRLLLAAGIGIGAGLFLGRRFESRIAATFTPDPQVLEARRKDLAEGRAVVARYDVEAAVKAEAEPDEFTGSSWFLRLADGSVVLVTGPHLEEAEEAGDFPATAFEVAWAESSGYIVSVRRLGSPLAPEAVRAPLTPAEWAELGESDDETISLSWSEVLDRAHRSPADAAPAERAAKRGAPARATAASADPIRPK